MISRALLYLNALEMAESDILSTSLPLLCRRRKTLVRSFSIHLVLPLSDARWGALDVAMRHLTHPGWTELDVLRVLGRALEAGMPLRPFQVQQPGEVLRTLLQPWSTP
mgnify:CR=1 FL=1